MRTLIVIIVVCLSSILLYKLNHVSEVVKEEDNIRVQYEGNIFPNVHKGGKHVLYYRNKKVCSDIAGISPNFYLRSPDKKLILYINEEKFDKNIEHGYEIYNIVNDSKIIFSKAIYIAGLNSNFEWLDDEIVLWNKEQKDVLDFKNSKMETFKIGDRDAGIVK
jgi:hypothetical protein